MTAQKTVISRQKQFYGHVGNVLMMTVKASFPVSMGVLSTGIKEKSGTCGVLPSCSHELWSLVLSGGDNFTSVPFYPIKVIFL
jgi:hypothetical protein